MKASENRDKLENMFIEETERFAYLDPNVLNPEYVEWLEEKLMNVSKDHNDQFTGILDMNGTPILKGSNIKIHERLTKSGHVIWHNGNYICSVSNYNIYAWRKSIEVLDSQTEPLFRKDTMEDRMEKFERRVLTFMNTLEERKIFREAFKLGYESHIELLNDQG
jgi:hypothetical protein